MAPGALSGFRLEVRRRRGIERGGVGEWGSGKAGKLERGERGSEGHWGSRSVIARIADFVSRMRLRLLLPLGGEGRDEGVARRQDRRLLQVRSACPLTPTLSPDGGEGAGASRAFVNLCRPARFPACPLYRFLAFPLSHFPTSPLPHSPPLASSGTEPRTLPSGSSATNPPPCSSAARNAAGEPAHWMSRRPPSSRTCSIARRIPRSL